MNFFESQDRARRKTGQLVFLFALATLSLVGLTNLLIGLLSSFSAPTAMDGSTAGVSIETHIFVSLAVLAVIAVSSLYKIAQLSGGGEVVAKSLGGRLLSADTVDPDERRMLNVVEEMAIASGLPVPPVYVLDDDAMNAFAAGFQPDDAVIGITRGCMRFLNREELQGVVAHEFSHILHGDMRINIRLIGVLYGILVIGMVGYFLMRTTAFRSRGNDKDSGFPILVLGIGLTVIGYAGTFFGNIIKASVSRQREYLADSSAVQYTRNPDGIANALKKIGGFRFGSRLLTPKAAEASHLFIGQAVKLSSLMATHPPIEERIKRLQPSWDGSFESVEEAFREQQRKEHFKANDSKAGVDLADISIAAVVAGAAATASAGGSSVHTQSAGIQGSESVLDSVGDIKPDHIQYAQQLLANLKGEVLDLIHKPNGARAAIYCLLMSPDAAVAAEQLAIIQRKENGKAKQNVELLLETIRKLGVEYRIPIIDLCLPVLKRQYEDQHRNFRACVLALMKADNDIDLFEWCLHRLFVRHLDSAYQPSRSAKVRYSKVTELEIESRIVLSALAIHGAKNTEAAQHAYEQGLLLMDFAVEPLLEGEEVSLRKIDQSLAELCSLTPLEKPKFIKACAQSVLADDEIKAEEFELLRAIADSLDVPLPPRLERQLLF